MAKVTGAALDAVAFGGLIREDLMQQIWDISNIPLPLTDAIGSGSHDHAYTEWQHAELAAPNRANAVVDGADVTGNDEKQGERVGNHSQISVKRVQVSQRAQNSNVAGQSDALAYQIMERQKELRRDVDAIAVTNQASVADDGAAIAGKSGGLGAWLKTNVSRGAGGVSGGFAAGLVVTPTPGTARALSETFVRNVAQAVYEEGGNPTIAMSTPAMIRKFSEYLFTSSARVATLMSDVGQAREAAVAKGSVNVFVTDFGITLELEANRLQTTYSDATPVTPVPVCNLYLLDPEYIELSYLQGYTVEPLAKTGTADTRLMSVDWSLKVLCEKAQGVVADVNPAVDAVA